MKKSLEDIYQGMLDSYQAGQPFTVSDKDAPNGAYLVYSDELTLAKLHEAVDLWPTAPVNAEGFHVVDFRSRKRPTDTSTEE